MATAAPTELPTTPQIVFDSRTVGLVSIVEERHPADLGSPVPSSPSPLPPRWREVEFGNDHDMAFNGLGVSSAWSASSSSFTSSHPGTSYSPRLESPVESPNVSSPKFTMGWSIVPPLPASSPKPSISLQPANGTWRNSFSPSQRKLSVMAPDIHEAIRQGSVAEVREILRKNSVAQPQTMSGTLKEKSSIEIIVYEESDTLGPLQSTFAPSPQGSLPSSPRASSAMSPDYFGKGFSGDEKPHSPGTTCPQPGKSPPVDSVANFKKFNTFAELHSFSFGQSSKGRKESSAGQDPILASPRLNIDAALPRPSSAHLNVETDAGSEVARDILLINPVTGERKMSIVKTPLAGEQIRRPSVARRESSAQAHSMYTLVRRDSVAAQQAQGLSTSSRPTSFARTLSVADALGRHMSTASVDRPRSLSFASNRNGRRVSSTSRHMSSTSNGRNMSNARALSSASYSRNMSTARTMSSSNWSRTMSTFSRSSSMTSTSSYGLEPSIDDDQGPDCLNDKLSTDCVVDQPRRKSSFLSPSLFGNFQWRDGESEVVLPVQEPTPAYKEALDDVEEDPDFVEVEVRPKAGSVGRRTSLLANVFSNKDVDVDPDLEFEPSASEKDIKQAVARAQAERGSRKMLYSRNVAVASFVVANAAFIALSFGLLSVWYALIPLILLAPMMKSVMVIDLAGSSMFQRLSGEKEEVQNAPMTYTTVLTCSNESHEDLVSSLDSIITQQGVEMHKQLLMIVCDDEVRGRGAGKATLRILLEDILTNITDEKIFENVYQNEDDERKLWCRRGIYKGIPYILTVQDSNCSKRDGLNVVRNLLYAYNRRNEPPKHSLSRTFFSWCREWAELHNLQSFDYLINASADTTLDSNCIAELYRQSLLDSKCVGVSSLVKPSSQAQTASFWSMYQNTEYMKAQLLKQFHQSRITLRVTSPPSACQILKVCDETCGPEIMKEPISQRPSPMDNMLQQIRSLAAEDDVLMCVAPSVTTRQAVHAVAYSRTASTFSNFLVQHQRFTLSTCANNLAVIGDSRMNWFERLNAAAELLAWCLPVFSLALITNFLRAAAIGQSVSVLIVIACVLFLPCAYAFASTIWVSRSWEDRLQYLLGLCFSIVLGPFMAVIVIASVIMNLHLIGHRKSLRMEGRKPSVSSHGSNV